MSARHEVPDAFRSSVNAVDYAVDTLSRPWLLLWILYAVSAVWRGTDSLTGCALWNVLSALRGPDYEHLANKKKYTAPLRGKLLYPDDIHPPITRLYSGWFRSVMVASADVPQGVWFDDHYTKHIATACHAYSHILHDLMDKEESVPEAVDRHLGR